MVQTKKVRIPFEQGNDPMFIGTISESGKGDEIQTYHLLTLVSFSVVNGSISWAVKDDRGQHFTAGSEMVNIRGTEVSLRPSIPLTLHQRGSGHATAPEFVFTVPKYLQVYPLSSVKKKYPQARTNLYRLR